MEWVDVSERGWLWTGMDVPGRTWMGLFLFLFLFSLLHFHLSMGYIRMSAKLCHVIGRADKRASGRTEFIFGWLL